VAINLDNATKLALGKLLTQIPDQGGIVKTKIDNLHLTLQFLGEVDEELIPQIQIILNTVAVQHQPFILSFAQLGAFPNWDQPHSIWIGVSCPNLKELQNELAQQLIKLVPTMDTKPFVPHLTLARIKSIPKDIDKIESMTNFSIPTVSVTHIDLMASTLTSQGPIHTILSRHRLT